MGGVGETVRCLVCHKALLVPYNCKCGGRFCVKHLGSGRHECGFDYLADSRAKLTEAMPKVVSDKVARI